ncbi:YhgE/Pip domain-containing protein [Bacillus sp. M6-12]|uniref:YhgE/Pip domain-containing protein n=1 Tax=Bacillus sp. M6-12 TaxID=2054166 RepID=UPI0015E078FC|nr:YhgE/Pip domain-containing protein [Bacillus sp. M6-12]
MKAFWLHVTELMGKKGMLISIIAVLLVPLVYAAIILTASWGPYDNLASLPVAVVNKDKGATSSGKPINVGEDLMKTLKDSNTLGWDFIDEKEAEQGLKNQKYYMVIEVPEDFSKNVTTVLDENPKKPELRYVQNEGLHFMAAQVTKSATERIREQLANKVTETYTRSLFDQLGEVSSGFQSGADGSQKIHDGTAQLQNGTNQLLTSLTEKSGDINKLASGSKELEAGTKQLYDSLSSKQGDISKLAKGAQTAEQGTGLLLNSLKQSSGNINQLAAGSKSLAAGAADLKAGTAEMLEKMNDAKTGTAQLKEALTKQIEPGSDNLAAGLTALNEKAPQLAGGSRQVADGIKKLQNHPLMGPLLSADPEFQKLVAGSEAVAQGAAGLAASSPQLKDGANALAGGIDKVTAGVATLDGGMSQFIAGQNKINNGASALAAGANKVSAGNATVNASWGKLTGSVAQLNNGISQISDGNKSVETGWNKLTSGAGTIHSGMKQVSNGNQTVAAGWVTMKDGVGKLDSGAVQLKDGSHELAKGLQGGADKTASINAGDKNIEMFSSPVELVANKINEFPMYRYANAPYILSLALFVGVLVMTFIVDLNRPSDILLTRQSWFAGNLSAMSILAVVQAVVVSVFSLFFIRLGFGSGFFLVGFAIIASLTFLMLTYFLVALGGNIGRFAAMAFLVLQLSTTGSALPIQMLPEGLQSLSRFLPLTYSNAGFRSIISLGDSGYTFSNTGYLLIFLAAGLILSLIVIRFKSKSPSSDSTLAA